MKEQNHQILGLAHQLGALQYGDFTLSAGGLSTYYFDGRLLTLHPRGAALVARVMLPIVLNSGAEAVGGPALGADPIVAALVLTSQNDNTPIRGFITRTQPKEHGAQHRIEGPLRPRTRVAVIDDTCTTGQSLLSTIEAVESLGCTVTQVATLLNRQQGGSVLLTQRGYPFTSLLVADQQGRVRPSA